MNEALILIPQHRSWLQIQRCLEQLKPSHRLWAGRKIEVELKAGYGSQGDKSSLSEESDISCRQTGRILKREAEADGAGSLPRSDYN